MLAIAAADRHHSETRTYSAKESGGLHGAVMWDDENVSGQRMHPRHEIGFVGRVEVACNATR